ncbi:MAG TPA: patatin-like phospholipase family protein [Burkholderiales bacterium]|nr:patatin-like phospholipase family protein [Burkholderiales bacterium]
MNGNPELAGARCYQHTPKIKTRINNMKLALTILLSAALAGCAFGPGNHNGKDAPRTVVIVPLKVQRPVLGLVLGAGGARGFAHVGVIKALEAEGLEADVVVGASSGALVASFYAAGMKAQTLEAMALKLEDSEIFDFTPFGPGRVEGARLQQFVNHTLNGRAIEALGKPFAAVATDLDSGRMAVFNRGNTGIAVRASASVPRLFWPVVINGQSYIDGGVSSRVPAALAREMGADVVIAVDISWRPAEDAGAADVVIRPAAIRSRMNDFQHRQTNIAAGETAARAVVGQIRERLAAAAARKARSVSASLHSDAAPAE